MNVILMDICGAVVQRELIHVYRRLVKVLLATPAHPIAIFMIRKHKNAVVSCIMVSYATCFSCQYAYMFFICPLVSLLF